MTSAPRRNHPNSGNEAMRPDDLARNDLEPELAPDRFYRFGKLGHLIGRFVGGAGWRTGARDTDPGA